MADEIVYLLVIPGGGKMFFPLVNMLGERLNDLECELRLDRLGPSVG